MMRDDPQTSIFRKESLERLSSPEQLDQLIQIVRPKSWLPLATLATLVGLGLLWSLLGRIPITARGNGILVYPTETSKDLTGLIYFEESEGDRIEPGMPIILVPNVLGSEQVGGILGRVKSVSEPPIMTLGAARQSASNPTALTTGATEVLVELDRDETTASGYKWTSLSGMQLELSPGSATSARIILEEKAPITFIFPFLEGAR
jgi:hypothetical protein